MSWEEHLYRLPGCTLILDTFIYGAHTTASDGLWMGVPIVSLSGDEASIFILLILIDNVA
jgi:protein O-GlcNAc transferase